MKKVICIMVFCMLLGALNGCHRGKGKFMPEETVTVVEQNVKIKVGDVSNNTGEIFDVDVIGLLWNSLDESLKKKGFLWMGQSASPPLSIEAHIEKYEKGNIAMRPFLPMWGKTLLVVRCDLKKGNEVLATLESKHTFSYGSGLFTIGGWRKIFNNVAEDLVAQIAKKV